MRRRRAPPQRPIAQRAARAVAPARGVIPPLRRHCARSAAGQSGYGLALRRRERDRWRRDRLAVPSLRPASRWLPLRRRSGCPGPSVGVPGPSPGGTARRPDGARRPRPGAQRDRSRPRARDLVPPDGTAVARRPGLSRPRPHDRLALDVRPIVCDDGRAALRSRRRRRSPGRVPRVVHERQLHLLDAGRAPVRVDAAGLLQLEATPRRFVLDPVRSDIYDDEIEGLFHDAEEPFLRHNVQELAQLAERANDGQRAWLRHFLDSVPDGPEKRAVMENLR